MGDVDFFLYEVMTAKEAGLRWGISEITLRQACSGYKGAQPRFTERECRRSGKIWLITRTGMERLYGKEKEKK